MPTQRSLPSLARKRHSLARAAAGLLSVGFLVAPLQAQEINTSALSQNGWFSDDTRADGSGAFPAGTNLISPSLTAAPEGASLAANPLHDADILGQIQFLPAPGTVPALTHKGAVNLNIAASGSGKSQISHRKDDPTGHAPGSAFGPGFAASFSWMGNGTPSVTASLKFGFKTAEFGLAGVSPRTGENAWDKVLIYEPGNGNGGLSDGLWRTETINFTTGKWWFFDRVAGAGTIGTPLSLSDMSTSGILVGGGPKTIAQVYNLITAPGAIVTSVQFGIGSGNPGGNVYVNQLSTNFYRPGQLTTFGTPSPFDQNVTPDAIFGSGNANGSFTVGSGSGVELGLRTKRRFPTPANVFSSNGDGTYTWNVGAGNPPSNLVAPFWSFEWSVNTDAKGLTGRKLDDLTYRLGIDFDPAATTNFLEFDPITPGASVPYATPVTPAFWDHSIGNNSTGNGLGLEANSTPSYLALLSSGNVAQNSWRMDFFDEAPFAFNPNTPGRYDFYLEAYDGSNRLARTEIVVVVVSGNSLTLEAEPLQQDAFPLVPGVQVQYELWLRNPNDVAVTGYQSFLEFNGGTMVYEGGLSSYSAGPFGSHIQPITSAQVASGKLRLDGNSFPSLTGTSADALLATLVFTVNECVPVAVDFDTAQPFPSELSFLGSPLSTNLLDSPSVLPDDTAPILAFSPNLVRPADAGSCTQAVVTYSAPGATDNCDLTPTVVCTPPSGSVFPVGVTTVTCTATDDAGNVATSTFTVTVTATNAVDVVVQLPGSVPTSRCIRFVADTCGTSVADVVLNFSGPTPTATTTIEIPCGVWTKLCAKDQQHTQWAESPLTVSGAKYVATLPLVLDGGDTDNDGDVDINDVTLLLAQFGSIVAPGTCPWNGARNADFNNNTAVGAEDYSFLVAHWLTTSACSCSVPLSGSGSDGRRQTWLAVRDALSAAADLTRDGMVDHRDVEVFERRHGLSGELSAKLRAERR